MKPATIALRLLVVLVFLSPLLILTPAASPAAVKAWPDVILSDTDGEIKEIVLQFSSSLEAQLLPTFASLLEQLENNTTVHLVCENSRQALDLFDLLESLKLENPERVRITISDMEITAWARDRFVSKKLKDFEDRIVIIPAHGGFEGNNRLNDRKIPAIISKAHNENIMTRQSDLFFEGGNLVANDNFLFTSYAAIYFNRDWGEKHVAMLFRREFGKKVVLLGSDDLPEQLEHVDMYLTPVGNSTVLLGDPSLAGKILDEKPEFEDRPGNESGTDIPDVDIPDIIGATLEKIGKQLRARGFKVERIPFCMDKAGNIITYNNVILETRSSRKIVYLPSYGIKRLDEAAMRIFADHDYAVKPVDVSKIYQFGGALRCVTNVVMRKKSE